MTLTPRDHKVVAARKAGRRASLKQRVAAVMAGDAQLALDMAPARGGKDEGKKRR